MLSIGLIIFGLASCFFGYKLFNYIMVLWGFVLGAFVVGVLVFDGDLIPSLICGIIGGAIVLGAYYIGIFLMGAIPAFLLASSVLEIFGASTGVVVVIGGLAGSIGGIIALLLNLLMIVLGTSFGGAFLVVLGLWLPDLDAVDPSLNILTNSIPGLGYLIWFGLGIAGVVYQLGGPENMKKQFIAARTLLQQKQQEFQQKIAAATNETGEQDFPTKVQTLWKQFRAAPSYPGIAAFTIAIGGAIIGLNLVFSALDADLMDEGGIGGVILIALYLALLGSLAIFRTKQGKLGAKAHKGAIFSNGVYIIAALWLVFQTDKMPLVELIVAAVALGFLLRDDRLKSYFGMTETTSHKAATNISETATMSDEPDAPTA